MMPPVVPAPAPASGPSRCFSHTHSRSRERDHSEDENEDEDDEKNDPEEEEEHIAQKRRKKNTVKLPSIGCSYSQLTREQRKYVRSTFWSALHRHYGTGWGLLPNGNFPVPWKEMKCFSQLSAFTASRTISEDWFYAVFRHYSSNIIQRNKKQKETEALLRELEELKKLRDQQQQQPSPHPSPPPSPAPQDHPHPSQ
jgi:hypothetical protein